MSDNTARSAEARHVLRNPRFWLGPIIVVAGVMSLLAAMYLGGILNPEKDLHDFPIALVNQDEGDTIPDATGGGRHENFGDQIAQGLKDGIPKDKIDLREIGISEAQREMRTGNLYGAIVIPSDFTKRLAILGQASVVPGDVEKPTITVNTNPRAGTFASAVTERIADQALTKVNATVGQQLTDQVNKTLSAGPQPTPLAGASRLTLAEPVNVLTVEYHPLPDGTGNGLSAFYYALLLVFAGFTGAMIVNALVDSMLGFAPTEFGPWYVARQTVGISRFRTLLLKWLIMVVIGHLVSGLYMLIGSLIGMPIERGLALYEYGAFAISAVGITASSVIAAFGSAGLLINLIFFIVLGLPSAGATIPIEAAPRMFEYLSRFEPMRQIFVGIRAILYFDASGNAGLIEACWMTLLGLAVGVVLGAAATIVYDRRGLHRVPKQELPVN